MTTITVFDGERIYVSCKNSDDIKVLKGMGFIENQEWSALDNIGFFEYVPTVPESPALFEIFQNLLIRIPSISIQHLARDGGNVRAIRHYQERGLLEDVGDIEDRLVQIVT